MTMLSSHFIRASRDSPTGCKGYRFEHIISKSLRPPQEPVREQRFCNFDYNMLYSEARLDTTYCMQKIKIYILGQAPRLTQWAKTDGAKITCL